MAQIVKLRRSATTGNKPTTAQLELGELAMNTYDGKIYFEKSGSAGESIEEILTTNAQNTGSLSISGSSHNITGALELSGSLKLPNTVRDYTNSTGSVGQVLQITENGAIWIDNIAANVGDGRTAKQTFEASTTWVFTHNLNEKYPVVELYDIDDQILVAPTIATNANTLTITFAVPVAGTAVATVGGMRGYQGFQGFQGQDGYVGADGVQGNQGDRGFQGFQGVKGDQGVTGDQGFQGPIGFQGSQGETGAQGAISASARNVTIFTTTLNQTTFTVPGGYNIGLVDVFWNGVKQTVGVDYTASNGTTVVLANGAAAGDTIEINNYLGEIGSQGNQGATGAQGSVGAQGATGNQGAVGAQGPTGSQGSVGAQGSVGSQGETGFQGNQGPTGLQGAKGDQGDQGTTGLQGTTGAQGFKGDQGFQGIQGFQGDQGIQGTKGDQGDQGFQGAKGDQGNQGPIGPQGIKGDKGDQGDRGFQGFQGIQGTVGTQGATGTQGAKGDQGYQGITGQGFIIYQTYNSVAALLADNTCPDGQFGLVGGSLSQSDPDYGKLYLRSGGTWSFTTDMSVQGIQGSTGAQGSTGQQGFKGDQGNQGDQGARGFQGDQGRQGSQGDRGTQGFQGLKGDKGDKGDQGDRGFKGDQGDRGFQGFKGDQGDRGFQGFQGFKGDKGDQGATGTANINGTGFVKASGTTISYDNSTYLTTSSASSTYLPLSGGSLTGNLTFSTQGSKIIFGDSTSASPSMIGEGLVNTEGTDSDFLTIYFRNSLRVYSQTSEIGRFTSSGLRVYGSIIKDGGTSSQFLKADGSIDSNTYAVASSYLPLAGGNMTGQILFLSTSAPFSFQNNGNTGTYTQTTIYANQNNTSGSTANGIFIERGFIDNSLTEIRHFVIGSRGGGIQWKLAGDGYTTQYDTAEVKAYADNRNFFVGTHSGNSSTLFRVYQASGDGYLELRTGANAIVTKLSGYTGAPNYTLAQLGIGKSSSISYMLDVDGGSTNSAAAQFVKQAFGAGSDGVIARFVNNSNEGYSSYIFIGSNPGTDWRIGKNISAPTTAVYNFEIVDSSNNLRMSIAAVSGNTTFNGNVTANALIKLGGTSSQYLMADGSVSTLSNPVTGTGTATYLPIWSTGTSLGNSLISQPDGNNVQINFADTYGMGGKFSRVSTFVSKLKLGRVGDAFSSNADIIYDIEGAEVFELRRNYSDAVFKISLGATAHLTIGKTGAATFNSSVTTGGITGIAVSPSPNTLSNGSIDLLNGAGLFGYSNATYLTSNLYYNGSFTFKATANASLLNLTAGGMVLYAAQTGGTINTTATLTPLLTITQTGDATFTSSITANGNITIVKSSPVIRLSGSAFGNSGAAIRFEGWASGSGFSNWQIDTAFTGGNELCFVPSTTAGGGTFTTPVFRLTSTGAGIFSSYLLATYTSLSSTQPLEFTGGGNTGTFNKSTIYSAQNNTSGSTANGIFIERGRLTDSGSAEVRHLVIGARGGSIQWMVNGTGYTTQYNSAEVKPSGDADYFVGRFSAGSAKCFVAYQSGSDGYLELRTGANETVTKLSGYTGAIGYTLAPFAVGQATAVNSAPFSAYGATLAASFATNQSGAGSGLCAYFINNSGGGYSSWIYIGSAPGTDWKIGKNISNPTQTTYNFEIVDSSNNVRLQINNSTGNATFSSDVIAYSDARLKKNIRPIENALLKVLASTGILYDRVDTTEINTFGFIAQDLEKIIPEVVTTNDIGIKGVKYQNMVALLTEAIKEQQTQIESQKTEIEELKDLVKQLINR